MEERRTCITHGIVLFIISLFLLPHIAEAAALAVAWDPNEDLDVAGYKVYYGTSPGNYTDSVDVGNVTEVRLKNLSPGLAYYLAVTAYDRAGNESGFSDEISGVAGEGGSKGGLFSRISGGCFIRSTVH
jgi:hypothetical protein